MKKIKKFLKKIGGEKAQRLVIWFLRKTKISNKIILFSGKKAEVNKVNINYWTDALNIGDAISPVVVKYVAKINGIDISRNVDGTKHLYAIGSIITAGCQDCTIWGSGLLNTKILNRLKGRKLDIRAVRGPLTRIILCDYGFDVPEIYGDPAIIMPLIYDPKVEKLYDVSVITHMNESEEFDEYESFHRINIMTDDYKTFIREIKESKLIISSSLHGIILAEVYGVPAILLRPKVDLLKYFDFYYSTKRWTFPIAESIKEALELEIPEIPDYSILREQILTAFPIDIWDC